MRFSDKECAWYKLDRISRAIVTSVEIEGIVPVNHLITFRKRRVDYMNLAGEYHPVCDEYILNATKNYRVIHLDRDTLGE